MQVLTSLFDFIKEETARNPDLDIHSLMEMIELMAKEKISLPLVQVSGSDKGVNLMTAHGAKGLEFDYVFLVGAVSKLWEKHKILQEGINSRKIFFQVLKVILKQKN